MAKILIVDDRAINREFLFTLLGYGNHEMLEAIDGAEALESVRAHHPDLVICDVLMPRMDGYEFVRQLRFDAAIAQTKVIFFSASYFEREAHDLAKAGGVLDVLTKPCAPEEIMRVVDQALSRTAPAAVLTQPEAFGQEHLRLITDKLSEKEEEQRAISQRLETLVELSLKLGSESDPMRLLDVVCEDARQLIGAKRALLAVRETGRDGGIHFATAGLDADVAKRLGPPAMDRGILGRVLEEGRTYRTASDAEAIGLPAGYMPVNTFLAAPITSLYQKYGWICLTDKIDNTDFSPEDERQLTVLGAQVGRIYENGNLYYKIQQHAAQLEIQIAERVSAEQELRESENKYRGLIEQASDGILVTDPEGNVLLANTRWCELLGYDKDDLSGLNARETYLDEERETHLERLSHVRAGQAIRFERLIRRKDGSVFPAEISVKMLDSGIVQGIFHDITRRKEGEQALIAERTLLRTLVDALPDVVFAKDTDGHFTMGNSAEIRHVHLKQEADFIGKTVFDFYPRELADAYHADDLQALSGRSVINREEISIDSMGLARWYLTNKVPLRDPAGQIIGMVGMSRDITERKEQEQKIARLSRIQAVLSGINSAIVRIRDRHELFHEACRIAVEHGGFSVGWLGRLDHASGHLVPVAQAGLPLDLGSGDNGSDRTASLAPVGIAEIALRENRPAFESDLEPALSAAQGPGPDTFSVRRAAVALGAKSAIVLPLYVEGRTFGVLTLYAPERDFFDEQELKLLTELAGDISFGLEYIAKEEKVDYLAYYDALCGLPNRSLFFDRLTHQIGSATRERSSVALVLLDIDRFRLFNDTLGRQAGDILLATVAQRLRDTFRDQDTVARVGADSFAIAVTGTWQADEAMRVLDAHNHQLFGQPFLIGHEELRVSATAGIAIFPGDGSAPETLFANAEAALQQAKAGGERSLFYSPDMNARVADALRLENRLRRALDNGEMVLWYQPKVSVKTREILGFEALMRWNDPDTGLVPPAQFIPLMEQTGLILQAGSWALAQVARDCKVWTAQGIKPPRIAVNVSPIQLRQRGFVDTVIDAARETENAGGALDLEITESTIMDNVEAIIPTLQTIRGLGVEIAVDDFGTGYSSLAYIARLPIHDLKIDRSFVVGMTGNEDSLAIVRSVISLAHALRLIVVAEGVETEEQAAQLLQLGCDVMQGYLVSRPVPVNEVPAWLATQMQPVRAPRPKKIISNRKKIRVGKKNVKRR